MYESSSKTPRFYDGYSNKHDATHEVACPDCHEFYHFVSMDVFFFYVADFLFIERQLRHHSTHEVMCQDCHFVCPLCQCRFLFDVDEIVLYLSMMRSCGEIGVSFITFWLLCLQGKCLLLYVPFVLHEIDDLCFFTFAVGIVIL